MQWGHRENSRKIACFKFLLQFRKNRVPACISRTKGRSDGGFSGRRSKECGLRVIFYVDNFDKKGIGIVEMGVRQSVG